MTTFIICAWGANDVIRPVEIDLEEALDAGQASLSNSNRFIATYIAQQIEKQFSRSQASRAITNIEQIVRYMNPLLGTYISGLAVRVPGVIDGPTTSGNGASGTGISQKDLDALRARYENLLKSERGQRAQSEARCSMLENMLRNEQSQAAQLQAKIQSVEQQRMEAEAKLRAATLELQQRERQLQDITNERDTLLAERTALETQHQFDEQRASGLEQQLRAAMQRIHETEQHLAQAMQYIASLEGDLRIARDERNDAMKQKERLLEQLKKCQSRVVASHRSIVPKDGDETLPDWLKRGV
jgi:hypothetical protein